jgi:hypothetical protein
MKSSIKLTSILASLFALIVIAQTSYASGFAAPVQITNPDTSPVPVHDIDKASRTPFHYTIDLSYQSESASFTVPAGKRLVIEQVASFVNLTQGSARGIYVNTLMSDNTVLYYYFNMTATGDGVLWIANQTVKIEAEGVVFIGYLNKYQLNFGKLALSGYLENINY